MMDNEVWRWVWTGLALLMGLGEIVTAGFFLLPFAIGAGLAAVAAWVGAADIVQWLLFFVGTGLSFLYVRRFMRAQDEDGGLVVGPGRYVGMEALVLETIDTDANTGLIRVEAEEWRAVTDGEPIDQGRKVEVAALRGTRLVVRPLDR
ncbi:MAG: NfeD family protein [Acidimicrobiia bacterium]|nr:NfeD family protein [Acidimicrobiia bacterium]